LKLYISSPFFNEPQVAMLDNLRLLAEGAGFQVLSPLDHKLDDGWTSNRIKDLKSADALFVWFDSLLPKGEFLFRVSDVIREEIQVPLPGEIINFISIGMQASGKAQLRPKQGLILPGQDPRGMEVSNVPTAFTVRAPGGVFARIIGPGAINLSEPMVMFEFGMAIAENIPVVGLGLAFPSVGPYHRMIDLAVVDLEAIPEALAGLKKALASKEQGTPISIGEIQESLKETQHSLDEKAKKKEEAVRKQMAEAEKK
jgi:hypothetical protein